MNINVGLKYNPATNLSFDVNLFNNQINDLIEWKLVAKDENNINIYSYFNINQVITKGIEFNATYTGIDNWEMKCGYQLLYAYDKQVLADLEKNDRVYYAFDSENLTSIKLDKHDYFGLYNRSRHMGNVKLNYNVNDKTEVNTVLTYRSRYGVSDSNGNGILDVYDSFVDGYILCDFGITNQIGALKSFHIGIKNVFDFTNPENINNLSGRLYYIGFKLNFK